MPARHYVIDKNGKLTYKSARGPLGFRAQEMEQALALTLLASGEFNKEIAGKPKPRLVLCSILHQSTTHSPDLRRGLNFIRKAVVDHSVGQPPANRGSM